MSTQSNGGPAFPTIDANREEDCGTRGMSLRDYFAAKAMQTMLPDIRAIGALGKVADRGEAALALGDLVQLVCEVSYQAADRMVSEREQRDAFKRAALEAEQKRGTGAPVDACNVTSIRPQPPVSLDEEEKLSLLRAFLVGLQGEMVDGGWRAIRDESAEMSAAAIVFDQQFYGRTFESLSDMLGVALDIASEQVALAGPLRRKVHAGQCPTYHLQCRKIGESDWRTCEALMYFFCNNRPEEHETRVVEAEPANGKPVTTTQTLLDALVLATSKPLAKYCTEQEWQQIRSALGVVGGDQ